jgi:hypothetical protein
VTLIECTNNRTASLGGQTLAQIVDVRVFSANFHALYGTVIQQHPLIDLIIKSACSHSIYICSVYRRQFDHVVYLDADCDNMFGWGNYLFWPQVWATLLAPPIWWPNRADSPRLTVSFSSTQLHGNNGTLYGWGLERRNLLFTSIGLGPGAIWGKGVGANQRTSTGS